MLENHSNYIVRALEVLTFSVTMEIMAVWYVLSWKKYGLKMWRSVVTRRLRRTAFQANPCQCLSVTQARF